MTKAISLPRQESLPKNNSPVTCKNLSGPSKISATQSKGVVLAFGTFDLFHHGHEFFLRQARALGRRLVVVVARDCNVAKVKGDWPEFSENERRQFVVRSGLADTVHLGGKRDRLKIVAKIQPQIIALGFDQLANEGEILRQFPQVKVVRLGALAPEKFKSSLLKKSLQK